MWGWAQRKKNKAGERENDRRPKVLLSFFRCRLTHCKTLSECVWIAGQYATCSSLYPVLTHTHRSTGQWDGASPHPPIGTLRGWWWCGQKGRQSDSRTWSVWAASCFSWRSQDVRLHVFFKVYFNVFINEGWVETHEILNNASFSWIFFMFGRDVEVCEWIKSRCDKVASFQTSKIWDFFK